MSWIKASPNDILKHLAHARVGYCPRTTKNKCLNQDCLWGASNPKHGDDTGNPPKGRSARRKYLARGKKYWFAPKKEKK